METTWPSYVPSVELRAHIVAAMRDLRERQRAQGGGSNAEPETPRPTPTPRAPARQQDAERRGPDAPRPPQADPLEEPDETPVEGP